MGIEYSLPVSYTAVSDRVFFQLPLSTMCRTLTSGDAEKKIQELRFRFIPVIFLALGVDVHSHPLLPTSKNSLSFATKTLFLMMHGAMFIGVQVLSPGGQGQFSE